MDEGLFLGDVNLSGEGSRASNLGAMFLNGRNIRLIALLFPALFRLNEFTQLVLLHGIDIITMVAIVRRLRTKQEHKNPLRTSNDLQQVEQPHPSQSGSDLSTNNGGQ